MIYVHNASFTYRSNDRAILAVDSINITVQEREFITIVGANGSGKSTLARLMNGLLIPSDGSIEIDGLVTSKEEHLAAIHQLVGLVFQNPDNQIIGSTVEEDVAFGPENLGLPSKEIRNRVDEALELVNMTEFASREPHMLSGGQKQRVAIAGVLAMRPKYLVLDEATSMLDPQSASEIMETLHRLHANLPISTILITHDPEESITADRIIVVHNGAIVLDGTPAEVYSVPDSLKAYDVRLPSATIIGEQLREAGIEISRPCLSIEGLVRSLC